ncbi:hypothetical protein SmJEL517_g04133 [Synchytrium microbalum]|uniref:DNA helicase n=1 Tax=Synchytrium microbalum TaxID=1806994 RepID=A0A507C3W4_9FUNG|nr:uncharacterized protein SmJEL517_g04133 [Synchytrium microbalum]TPX32804.1 hypothetical protein SmJEL517_g04133 [Synchytrium microbalum]
MSKSKYVEDEYDELGSDAEDTPMTAPDQDDLQDEDSDQDDDDDEMDELASDSYSQGDEAEYGRPPSRARAAKSKTKAPATKAVKSSGSDRRRSKGSPSGSSTGSSPRHGGKSAGKAKGRKSRLSGKMTSEEDFDDDDDEDQAMDEDEDEDEMAYETPNSSKPAKKNDRKRKKPSSSKSQSSASKSKLVPYDPVVIPMGGEMTPQTVDKFLGWRVNPENPAEEQMLVKYKNMSYYHAQWLPRETVEFNKMAAVRVRRFLEKPAWETQWNEDEFFNPSFVKIDRLVDEGELEGAIYFLVKWGSLTYDMCTWETQETVKEIDEDKIAEFHASRVLLTEKRESQLRGDVRPPFKNWKKIEISPTYKDDHELRPYQLEGLNWLTYCWFNKQNSILADEMGLGKTVQSVVFLHNLYVNEKVMGPFLIITPLSTIGNWEREIKGWTDLNLVVYHGNEMARNLIVDTEFYYRDGKNQIIPGVHKFDIILTTYEMAMAGVAQLKPIQWRTVILDEAHRLKKNTSKISETLKAYRMDHRVLLTGTPLQNSLEELWSLLNFLEPSKFADERVFQNEYGNLRDAADVERLQLLLKPLMLRRLKEDVEKSIPVKEETIIEVELTTMQKKWYRSILEKNFTWLKAGSGKKTNTPQLINTMMELRKCCIHPFLLKGAEEQIYAEYGAHTNEEQFSCLIEACGKMVLIDKLLKKLKDGKHKVLIFSQMTKCLDIIQDYLRRKAYGFERIDGSVRGDVRQAAIDRFCSGDSESFVFLLCTRAGGVGINLTVADTVIIFDSDWNPQNDLQAQSRCHRIGQTKAVQIYRLITRGTYEREMFDRASIKLGLDRAVLQRMGSGGGGIGPDEQPTQLSKMEVETLLKKGAYGAFMDDEASKAFCEEDIDQILERRTQVIKHDANDTRDAQGSIFSKASFASAETDAVALDDPEFWDKVAQKASLNVVHQQAAPTLIMEGARERRQTQRFGGKDDDDSASEVDIAAVIREVTAAEKKIKPQDLLKPWSGTERQRFERRLMNYGFGQWDKMARIFNRRSIPDLKAAGRLLLQHCITQPQVVDLELAKQGKEIIDADAPAPEGVGPEIPYLGATQNQILEFKSFLEDTTIDHRANLGRRAKSILTRIVMLWSVKSKIDPHPGTIVPVIQSTPPAPWWGLDEDRDLLIGVVKHGYGQYDNMKVDPELIFSQKKWAKNDEEYVLMDEGGNADEKMDADDMLDDAPLPGVKTEDGLTSDIKMDGDMDDFDDVKPPIPIVKQDVAAPAPHSENGFAGPSSSQEGKPPVPETDMMAVDVNPIIKSDENGMDIDHHDGENGQASAAEDVKPPPAERVIVEIDLATGLPFGVYRWPTSADLGVRIKRLVAGFQRAAAAEKKASLRREKDQARVKVKKDKEIEKSKSKERDLTKREKVDFVRMLHSFGVETVPGEPNVRDWNRFRQIANLERKSSGVLEAYYVKLISLCHECIEKFGQKDAANGGGNAAGHEEDDDDDLEEAPAPKKGDRVTTITRDGDAMNLIRARRILFHVELFRKLRQEVITSPVLDARLALAVKHEKSGLPKWYVPELHDRALLEAVARYGILRSDLMVQDKDLPFGERFEEYTRLKGGKAKEEFEPTSWLAEPFWMSEQVSNRRVVALIDLVTAPEAKQTVIEDYEGKMVRRNQPRRRKPRPSTSKTPSSARKGKARSGSFDTDEEDSEDPFEEEVLAGFGPEDEADMFGPVRASSRTPKPPPMVDLGVLEPKVSRPPRVKSYTPPIAAMPTVEAQGSLAVAPPRAPTPIGPISLPPVTPVGGDSGDDTDEMMEQAAKRTKKQRKIKDKDQDTDYRTYPRGRKGRTSTPKGEKATKARIKSGTSSPAALTSGWNAPIPIAPSPMTYGNGNEQHQGDAMIMAPHQPPPPPQQQHNMYQQQYQSMPPMSHSPLTHTMPLPPSNMAMPPQQQLQQQMHPQQQQQMQMNGYPQYYSHPQPQQHIVMSSSSASGAQPMQISAKRAWDEGSECHPQQQQQMQMQMQQQQHEMYEDEEEDDEEQQ